MNKTRVIEITKYGRPEVLKVKEIDSQPPKQNDVSIKVKAIGLNFADVFKRLGLYEAAPKPPFVPGFEVSGVVEKLGRDVTKFVIGQKVIGVVRFGAYKTNLIIEEKFVRPIPKKLTFEQAAGLPTTYLSAYHGLLNLAHLQEGEKVLIHAAAGGVGTAALQLAKIKNATIYATCGSEEKVEFLRSQGVSHVYNYSKCDFKKEILKDAFGIDVILDSVGGTTFRKGYELLNPMGRLIIFGLGSLMPNVRYTNWLKLAYQYLRLPKFNVFKLIPDNKTISGFNLVYMFDHIQIFNRAFDDLLKWANEGQINPIVGKFFNFSDVVEAHKYLQSRKSIGKVVLTLD